MKILGTKRDAMDWLKSNWRWASLNLFATLTAMVVMTQGRTGWGDTRTFDPMLESGKWAIRFLLICLAMSPLNSYFGWSSALKLRKPAGLWSFGFAAAHFMFYVADVQRLSFRIEPFFALGAAGLSILTALAVTSNRRVMRRLGKYWKRLHRLVYFSGIAVTSHAMLAASVSKRVWLRDPQGQLEIKIYFALLVILLVVRIPLVRRALKQIPLERIATLLERPSEVVPLSRPIANPEKTPEYVPKIYAREDLIPFNEFLAEMQFREDIEQPQSVATASEQNYTKN